LHRVPLRVSHLSSLLRLLITLPLQLQSLLHFFH
jgi:hypothetical protein